ncbi:His-Xaa-Ser system radical SAM maturase HxsC [Bradyrhizobium erythrophlei]|uniref:His-Xaa-Ser system radical SAM maturase HxsC n=1 Tax=Bradyrhizobium erythrophlei TaxID=1437360 RepID=A0A1M7T695_9BRAD|nr:His-Xaa-Ser system radical SAM maturase HxsC [Bradyrhizobium erythrophlei]SHN66208.1 His-Xaa-Ser system radical SAM maturase HxsC [Bradyrhizobium erythrophlei]
MTLPLFGVAKSCAGFADDMPRTVVRLRSPEAAEPFGDYDFALVKSTDDISQSLKNGRRSIFVIGDSADISTPVASRFDRTISLPTNFDYLGPGDILGFHIPTKKFRTLFRENSRHNSFLVTERCNNYCLMCSQPPKDIDDRWILDEIKKSLPLVPKTTRTLTFTGGEPLSDWVDFIKILKDCRNLLPDTAIQVLTNGRAFANSEIVDAWKAIAHPSLIAAIPVYAAVDYLHDYVVQANGAFDETILGILKLKDRGQRVEVRVVLHAHTAPSIAETSRWIARNLPFVDHVALMGMENTGFALANEKSLWIDPIDYRESLAEGVQTLSATGMNVSIYNLPLCVIEPIIWPHAVQSISDWKNGYVEECEKCAQKSNCSGLFTSGRPRQSRGISAILNRQPAA